VQIAKSSDEIAKKKARHENLPRTGPGPRLLMDLGLSKRHRSVGLIQLHQTLDPRVESMQHIVTQLRHMETEDHKPTRGEPRIKRCRSRRE
jgi:hypothetical protein